MNRFESVTRPLMWFMALLLVALAAGCGGGGGGRDPILGADVVGAGTIPGAPPGAILPGAVCPAGVSATIPTVTVTDPTSGNQFVTTSTSGVAGSGKLITANFSLAMSSATIDATSFTLAPVGGTVLTPASVGYNTTTHVATLTTSSALLADTSYTAIITTAVTSNTGTRLSCTYAWNFKTAASAATGLPPVNLGRATNFAVLAATSITNTQPTIVTGDVGSPSQTVPPTLTAGYTNYQNVGDQPLIDALADMQTAITDANSRTCSSNSGAIDFGGLSLAPGVYCVTGAINITGTLSLNAPGVYIFRTTTTLDTVASAIVQFTGSATKANTSVFWVPVGATTLGALTVFKGTIMTSAAAITLGAGALLQDGRVFSGSAATLSGNTITKPTP